MGPRDPVWRGGLPERPTLTLGGGGGGSSLGRVGSPAALPGARECGVLGDSSRWESGRWDELGGQWGQAMGVLLHLGSWSLALCAVGGFADGWCGGRELGEPVPGSPALWPGTCLEVVSLPRGTSCKYRSTFLVITFAKI